MFTRTAQASCLVDEPRKIGQYKYPEQLPGQLYDADTQCKWQFGSKAKLCSLDFVKVGYLSYFDITFTDHFFACFKNITNRVRVSLHKSPLFAHGFVNFIQPHQHLSFCYNSNINGNKIN